MTNSTASLARAIASFDLTELNRRFELAHPRDILAWCVRNIPTGLVQASAFNIDDIIITDILYRCLKPMIPVPVLFIDTLNHSPETLEAVAQVKGEYNLALAVVPISKLQRRDSSIALDTDNIECEASKKFPNFTIAKPLEQSLKELSAIAWITGRHRQQETATENLPILERDTRGRLTVNPLANWTRTESWAYAYEQDLPVTRIL